MTSDKKKKIGFLNQFRAFNVNISEPETDRKWNTLRQIVQTYAIGAKDKYSGNAALSKLVQISQNTETPDELMKFGNNLLAFVESANNVVLKEDKTITKIIETFATTAKLSHDERIIGTAIDTSDAIIAIKKEK